jgi:exo-beta-1,3-glucanase (GH17 family)
MGTPGLSALLAGVVQSAQVSPRSASRPLACVAFSPYVNGYSPAKGLHPTAAVIDVLLNEVVSATDFRCVMTYGVVPPWEDVFKAAATRGLTVISVVWLDGEVGVDTASIAAGIRAAERYPNTIVRLACGSEVRIRHGVTAAEAIVSQCVSALKDAGVKQPIGITDSWWGLCDESWPCRPWRLPRGLDWIGANIYPWWENKYSGLFPCTSAAEAADFHVARLRDVMRQYPSTDVILTEFGWPAGPDGYTETNRFTGQRCGVASSSNQRLVINETVTLLRRLNLSHVVFSAFREPWKVQEGPVGPWWGLSEAPGDRSR